MLWVQECGSVGRRLAVWSPGFSPQHYIKQCDEACLYPRTQKVEQEERIPVPEHPGLHETVSKKQNKDRNDNIYIYIYWNTTHLFNYQIHKIIFFLAIALSSQ